MHASYAIVVLVFLLGVGVPVAWSFAGTLGFLIYFYDVNLNTLMLQGFRSLNSVTLLALPLFITAGYLMQAGGIAKRLVDFLEQLVKNRQGGLGATLVLACGVFGAIAGTATAAVASIGTIMTEPMEKRGYPRQYTAALLGISSLLGILIPPSITMILFGVVTQQSITTLFAASIGPGVLLIIGLILFNYFSSQRLFREIPYSEVTTEQERQAARENDLTQATKNQVTIPRSYATQSVTAWSLFLKAFPALLLPIVMLGGIYGGVFTPTEAAAVIIALAILVGAFIYKELTFKKFTQSLTEAAETTGIVVLILLFSFLIGRILVSEGVPQDLTVAVTQVIENPLAILIVVNLFLILVGMIIDDVSLTVVIAPLLIPLVGVADVNPIQFAAIVGCSVVVGSNSPPMAPVLYMSCRIAKVAVHRSFSPALAMILFVAIPVQLLTTFVPAVSLFIPQLLGLL